MQVTLTLSDKQIEAINEALQTRSGKNAVQIVEQAFNLGIRQLNYRTERNKEQYASFKEWRALQSK